MNQAFIIRFESLRYPFLCVLIGVVSLSLSQLEFIELDRMTAQWDPPPPTLSEKELQQVEQDAKATVQSMRANEDEVHATRLQSLKDTLATIREGGAARLKAEKDAAAVRS